MGGHGGLNILPQKKWNVYNFDNREKVRKDEEAAAKEEQLKREQSRKRDSESRLLQLRRARGLDPQSGINEEPPSSSSSSTVAVEAVVPESSKSNSDSKHINLFEGIRIFDPIEVKVKEKEEEGSKKKKAKKEEVRVVGPEDEKYRLGYGVAGKGVKAPWYAVKPPEKEEEEGSEEGGERMKAKPKGKKTLEELREERLKREKAEKERERALVAQNRGGSNGRYQRERDRRQWW